MENSLSAQRSDVVESATNRRLETAVVTPVGTSELPSAERSEPETASTPPSHGRPSFTTTTVVAVAFVAFLVPTLFFSLRSSGPAQERPKLQPPGPTARTVTSTVAETTSSTQPTSVIPTERPIPPGRYRTHLSSPEVSVTLAAGWNLLREAPQYVELTTVVASLSSLSFLAVQSVFPADRSFASVEESQAADARAAPPADLVAWLRTHPRLTVGTPEATTVGGYAATKFELVVSSGYQTAACPDPDRSACVLLFGLDGGRRFWLRAASRNVVFIVRYPGQQVAVVIEADAPDFEAFVADVGPVISSVQLS